MQASLNIDVKGVDALCGIYALRRADKPGVYIGQSTSLNTRAQDHKKNLKRGDHRNSRMQHIYNKHGDVFTFEVLCCGFDPKDKDLLTLAEQEFMDAAPRQLLNQAQAAGSMAGYKHSDATRAKMCEANKGKKPSGVPLTEKQRAALVASGLARRGKPGPWAKGVPSELRAKMSEGASRVLTGKPSWMSGKKHKAESLAKMSVARKGRVSPNKGVPRTAEQTAKQSATMKALCATPEHKEKMRKAAKARAAVGVSEETRAKLRAAASRRWAKARETK